MMERYRIYPLKLFALWLAVGLLFTTSIFIVQAQDPAFLNEDGAAVRVMSETGHPVARAIVLRRAAGDYRFEPYSDEEGSFLRTNSDGYLVGTGELGVGDSLVALAPAVRNQQIRLYYSSASPTVDGVDAQSVDEVGVQTLTVSLDNPFLLFDISVSLEWDARNDPAYLENLQHDLKRASETIFDLTNGQAALGEILVYQDKRNWFDADVVVFARNNLRPNSTLGGMVNAPMSDQINDTEKITGAFRPGQIPWGQFGIVLVIIVVLQVKIGHAF
jgi:hypothetical protein